MKPRRHLLLTVATALLVVVADQITKSAITAHIRPGEAVDVLGPLRFTLTYNDGVAFGLAGGRGALVILLAVVALMALGAFIATAPARWPTVIAGGLILGGAAGNLIDRFRIGHVTDFILFPRFPAFNLADSAITVGVLILAWWLITGGVREDETEDDEGGEHPAPVGHGAADRAGTDDPSGSPRNGMP